jgi:pilus assembly protein Flp/PilA
LARGAIPACEVGFPGHFRVTTMMNLLKKLWREEDGPTAVEYGVMLALIVAVCIGAVNAMAQATAESFDASAAELEDVLG